jgi:acetoacetyl-CoA synthetase
MHAFLESANASCGLSLSDYADLYRWSVTDLSAFWARVWDFAGVRASVPFNAVLPHGAQMYPRPDFFSGARMNYAENLLFPPDKKPHLPAPEEDAPALILVDETGAPPRTTTWRALREAVRRFSNALRASGVGKGDVVAGLVANHEQALVAMLAAAAVGAAWTALSPDTGVSAALDRYTQIRPRVLIADDGAVYNGKQWAGGEKVRELVRELRPLGLEVVVVVKALGGGVDLGADANVDAVNYDDFLERYVEDVLLDAAVTNHPRSSDAPLAFEQLPPAHPLYILYSSGTTGLPKAIVHTAAGTLLQHKKEHALHCSLSSASRMLYFTTTSWMMWHWSASALAVGATLVLYAGSPFKPHGHESLPRLLSDLKVTHFGTSAAYLTALEADKFTFPPNSLPHLEAIYSTASPLPPSTFRWVYSAAAFPPHVNLASITGGTDIISLFGAPCPLLPVRVGEIQCAGLGMAVRSVDSATGADLAPNEPGDLVCAAPFPCQPLTFWGPGGDEKYRAAYFDRFADAGGARGAVWHHGDFVRIPDPATGALVMLGRSDGVLKPSGVRFGSAEIYNVLTRFFGDVVEDAVCVGRRRETDRDETVCLFVVLSGQSATGELDLDLRERIKTTIRNELSPRHVPGVVELAGAGVPRTANGKK